MADSFSGAPETPSVNSTDFLVPGSATPVSALKPIDPNAQLKLAARDKATDPFLGLQEVKSNDPFAGLQEVKANDPFSGLQKADDLDIKDVKTLTDDDAFRPADYLAANPNLRTDASKSKKLIDVYRARRIRGLEAGKVAKAAVTEAPGIIAKTAKGARDLASRIIEVGIQPAATSALATITGATPEDKAAIMAEQGKEQLKAAGEVIAGTESAITGLSQLGQQGMRKLFGKSPSKMTDSELLDQLYLDSEFSKTTKEVSEGRGDVVKAAGLDAETLAKNGVTLDKEAIETLSLVDPLTLVATAGAFKVVGLGGKVIATAATRAGAQSVITGLGKIVQTLGAKGVEAVGKVAEVTGKTGEALATRLPAKSIGFVLGATKGGSLHAGAIGAAAGEAAKRIGVETAGALAQQGARISEIGRQLSPSFVGPRSAGLSRLLSLPSTPVGQIATTAAKGAVQGAVTAAPLAAAADESQTAGALLGGGAALGAIHGTVTGTKAAVAETVAKNYLDPHNILFEPTNSPGYGVDKSLDISHDAAIAKLPENEQNAVNTFREAVRAGGGEIYVQDAGSYLNRIRENLTRENGGKPLTPEQEAQAKLYADTHAFFDGQIPDAKGETRRVVFLNSDSTGLHHDAGHLFQSLLSPENQNSLRESALSSYSKDQLQAFKDEYARRIGEPDYFSKLGSEADAKAADELIAENFGQLFQNKTFADLSAPRSFLKKLGDTAVKAAEALGLDLTAGRKTADLGVTPSFRLQDLLRNAAQDVLTREPKPVEKAPRTLRPEDVARREANVPVTKEITPESVKPVESAPEAKPAEVSPKEPISPPAEKPVVSETPSSTAKNIRVERTAQSDFASKRAEETGISEAQKATESQPEVRRVVDDIAKSMEAGNPVLEVEHRGIVSEKGPGNPEGRTSRRGTQEAGYQELERLQVENRKEAPADIVDTHQKTFVPVRFTTQGGKPTLIAMSLDKVIANVRRVVKDVVGKSAESLLPYPVENGKLTDAGWKQAIDDIKAYAENQSNGYRGDGKPLVRPTEDIGVSLPAENPNYTPKPLSEASMNFANLVHGLAPPETGRVQKGLTPGNVKGQLLAEVNKKQPMRPAVIKPENVTKQGFKGFEPREVAETNPLRNELAARGVKVRELTEVTERLAVEDIASVKPRPELEFKAPVTDVIRAGFLPKKVEKLLSELPPRREKTVQDFSTSEGRTTAREDHKRAMDYLFSDNDKTPERLGGLLSLSPDYFQDKAKNSFTSTSDRIYLLKNGGESMLKKAAKSLDDHSFLEMAWGRVPPGEISLARRLLETWRREKHPEDYASKTEEELSEFVPGETGIRVPAPKAGPFGMFRTNVPPEHVSPLPVESLTGTGFESHKELVSAMLSPEAAFDGNPLLSPGESFSEIVQNQKNLSIPERGELRELLKKKEGQILDIAGILDGETKPYSEYGLPQTGGIAEAGIPRVDKTAGQGSSLANYADTLYQRGEFPSRGLAYEYVRDTAQSILAAKNVVRWSTGFFRDQTLSDSIKTGLRDFAKRVRNSSGSVWERVKDNFFPPEVPEPFLTQKSLESVNWGLVEDTIRSLSPEDYKQDFGNLPEHRISDVTENLTLHPEKSPNSYSPGDRELLQKIYRYGREQLQDRGESTAKFLPDAKPSEPTPSAEIRSLATNYAKSAGIDYRPARVYSSVNPDVAKRIADFYDSAQSNPQDPAVQASYRALIDETAAQYKTITDAGYKIEPYTGNGEPYKNSAAAVADIRDNKHLYFLTPEEGFASASDNPMLAPVEGTPYRAIELFRAVHDFFGHGKEGYQFGPRGEFNAWRAHSEMYSPESQGALAAETLAQNFWTNYGQHVRDSNGTVALKGQPGYVELTSRPFPEQKNVVVPAELIDAARKAAGESPKFLPSDKPVAELGPEVAKMSPDEWRKFTESNGGHLTPEAYKLGLGLKDKADLELLRKFQAEHDTKGSEALKSGDFDTAMTEATKGQFFREAAEAATDTGSAANPRMGWRKVLPDAKPPFAAQSMADRLHQESFGYSQEKPKFLPRTEAGKKAAEKGFEITVEGNLGIREAVIRKGDKVVGKIVSSSPENISEASINFADVNPKLRGQGLGEAAYRELLTQLKEDGVKDVTGITVAGQPLAIREKIFGKGSTEITDPENLGDRGNIPVDQAIAELNDGGLGFNARNKITPESKFLPKTDAGKELAKKGFDLQLDENSDKTQFVIRAVDKSGADVGRMEFHLNESGDGEIKGVEVNKEFREKGIGEALYREAGQKMKDLGVTEVSGEIIGPEAYHLRKKVFPRTRNIQGGAEHQADYLTVSDIGPRSKFLPKKRGVTEADVSKRDDQNRPLTAEGLVDYEKLYAEMSKKKKKDEAASDADLAKRVEAGAYKMPENAPKAGPATGWILPDQKFVPLDAAFHEQFLAENSKELNQKFGTKFSSTANVEHRLDALNRGFVRMRYTPGNGGMSVELSASHWNPKTKRALLNQVELNSDRIDYLSVTLLDQKGKPVDYSNEFVAELEGAEKYDALSRAIGTLRGGGAKFLPASKFKESDNPIDSAAVRTPGGKIFTGTWHGAAYDALKSSVDAGKLNEKLSPEDLDYGGKSEEGYVTAKGDFLDRLRAFDHAKKIGQLAAGYELPPEDEGLEAIDFSHNRKFLPSDEQTLPGIRLPSPEKIQQDRIKARVNKAKDKFPEALPPEYAKDDAGKFITDFNGKPKPVLSEYRFADTPVAREAAKGIRGPEAREDAASTAIAEKLVTAAKAAQKNPDIAAGVTWYSTARTRLKKLLGDDTKLFSELLGATSARTPVETNFRFSLDAYNQFKRGAYDDILKKYREGKDRWVSGEIGDYVKATKDKEPTRAAFMDWWIQKHDLTPTQSNGKKFAMNSQAVLKVLDGSWATEVKGPKTPNFAGNLSGQTFEATIDVWASRLIHRLANEGSDKPWRILPENEAGLSDSDFFLGQAIFRKAAEKLKMKPDALQAILWFAEKDHWEKNGWTRGAGAEKSDFNSLLKETELTPSGVLKQKTPQLDLGLFESDITPRKK